MSKTPTPEPAQEPHEQPQVVDDAGPQAEQQEQNQEPTEAKGRPNEAAKYRRQLREAEKERDGLRSSLDSARRELMKAGLRQTMLGRSRAQEAQRDDADQVPQGAWSVHESALDEVMPDDLGEFFTDGTLDQDKLQDYLYGLLLSRKHLFERYQGLPVMPDIGRLQPMSLDYRADTFEEAFRAPTN